MRASLSLLCTQTQENPLPIHAVDPDTTSAVVGWWPERRRTARKEPPFWSMWRGAAAALSVSSLPRRDSLSPSPPPGGPTYATLRAAISAGSPWPAWVGAQAAASNPSGREIPRPDHGEGGRAGRDGLHEAWRRGLSPVALASVWLAALALLPWLRR